MPLSEARKTGAMMLFGEKYPDVVRVVSVGAFSKELCGGTHLDNSGRVGLFKILSDESVSAGTRRITALTGRKALVHVRGAERSLTEIAAGLKVPAADVPERVAAMAKEVRQLKKQQSAAPKGGQSLDQMIADATDIGDVKVIVAEVPTAGPQVLRQMIDQLRKKVSPLAVFLGSPQGEGKVMLMAGLSRELVAKGLNAVEWVRKPAEAVDGGGGGRPDMAQAGGKDESKLPEALKTANSEIRRLLGA
jgi:alanyl-tRNA synthetase